MQPTATCAGHTLLAAGSVSILSYPQFVQDLHSNMGMGRKQKEKGGKGNQRTPALIHAAVLHVLGSDTEVGQGCAGIKADIDVEGLRVGLRRPMSSSAPRRAWPTYSQHWGGTLKAMSSVSDIGLCIYYALHVFAPCTPARTCPRMQSKAAEETKHVRRSIFITSIHLPPLALFPECMHVPQLFMLVSCLNVPVPKPTFRCALCRCSQQV